MEKADPWETRSISNSLEIKLDLPTEITSPLLPISNLSPDKPTHVPELVENMVTVDHDLSGGVISPLYSENSDDAEEINFSITEESPSDTLLKTTPDKETLTSIIDLYSANEEEPQISLVNLYPPIKEGTESVESEPEPRPGQFTSNSPEGDFQTLPSTLPSHTPE